MSTVDNPLEHAVDSFRVAHVTFYITPHPDLHEVYDIYSATRDGKSQFIEVAWSLEEAHGIVKEEAEKLETTLAAKRDKSPTAKQILFLFREKIPIPVNLTWGEASDLIDERLVQIASEKQARQQAKEEKQRVREEQRRAIVEKFAPLVESKYREGDKVRHPSFGEGVVLHAGYSLANVQFQDGKKMLGIEELTNESEAQS